MFGKSEDLYSFQTINWEWHFSKTFAVFYLEIISKLCTHYRLKIDALFLLNFFWQILDLTFFQNNYDNFL